MFEDIAEIRLIDLEPVLDPDGRTVAGVLNDEQMAKYNAMKEETKS